MAIARLAVPVVRVTADRDTTIIRFLTIESFILIYLQKFAIASLSVPMLAMISGLAAMTMLNVLWFNAPIRLIAFFAFACCCLLAVSFTGGSFTSIAQLLALYSCLTVCTTVNEKTYLEVNNRFVKLMVLPATIMLVQYMYQKATGLPDFISMNKVVPQSMLLQGYFYEAHYPWYSTFTRPNGFFLLEPSFASAFTATAAIIEITYFRRAWLAILMLSATAFSMGATGITMLLFATPFLLAREKVGVVLAVIATGLTVVVVATALDMPLPLISRASELDQDSSSGGERLLLPAQKLGDLAFDPKYFFLGEGAGASVQQSSIQLNKNGSPKMGGTAGTAIINPWPMVKVLTEYGLLSMIAYLVLFCVAITGRYNIPLKVALSVEFLFTGGYLVSPPFMGLMTLLFFVFTPDSAKPEELE